MASFVSAERASRLIRSSWLFATAQLQSRSFRITTRFRYRISTRRLLITSITKKKWSSTLLIASARPRKSFAKIPRSTIRQACASDSWRDDPARAPDAIDRHRQFKGVHMDDQFLVDVPEAPPQGPLLFFVRDRRRRIVNAALIFIALAIPLVIFSWNIHKLAKPRISWEFLLAAAIIAFLIYRELILIVTRFHLLKPGPTLVLYEEGIYDRRLGDQIIPWTEITRIQRSQTDPWW